MHISEVFKDFRPKFDNETIREACDNLSCLCPQFPTQWVMSHYDVKTGIRNSIAKYESISDYSRAKLNTMLLDNVVRNLIYSFDGVLISQMISKVSQAITAAKNSYDDLDLIPKLYPGISVVIAGDGFQGIRTGTITTFDPSMRVYYLSLYKPERDSNPKLRYFATVNEEDIHLSNHSVYQGRTFINTVRANATEIMMQGFSFE